ncbi:MAG: retaining beta-glycosidase [Chthonomonadaceae bacterium]|nr:retaining beta-glycosidase [Chthonomonadaceae bacterium]
MEILFGARARTTHRLGALIVLLGCLFMAQVPATAAGTPGPWLEAQAQKWQQKHGWLVGCNFSPSYAVNELEMWQADTFDPAVIDRELGWAQGLGFNSVRVFLHNMLWDQDSQGFLKRMDTFLGIADRHHIGVMFVLFDSCWDPFPILGKQREPRPFVHNSGWVQAPGQEILKDPKLYDTLKPYVVGVLQRFKNDRRVHAWDLFNEPDNTNGSSYGKVELKDKPELALELLTKVVGWTREVAPSQPATVCVWFGDWGANDKLTPMQKYSLENSDVVSFHNYGPVAEVKRHIEELRRFHRPILCTEYMARPNNSPFDPNLGFMKSEGVAAYNWGFVSGKTQTIYPWDSWQKAYTGEPPVWFHDIFRTNGAPYRPTEVAYIRSVTGRKPKR